jgi:hypothetical protein
MCSLDMGNSNCSLHPEIIISDGRMDLRVGLRLLDLNNFAIK